MLIAFLLQEFYQPPGIHGKGVPQAQSSCSPDKILWCSPHGDAKNYWKGTYNQRDKHCDLPNDSTKFEKKCQTKATYSKNISKMSLIAPSRISSFSAASLPIVNRTEMKSTI